MVLGYCKPEILCVAELLGLKMSLGSLYPFVSELQGVKLFPGGAGVGGEPESSVHSKHRCKLEEMYASG